MTMHDEIVVAGLPLQFPKPTAGTQLPTLAEWNQRYIEYVLNFTKGKKTAAARILGINRRTLYRRKKPKTPANGEDRASSNEHTSMMESSSSSSSSLEQMPVGHQVQ